MSAPGISFAGGDDGRRNRAGRPPSGAGIARMIRAELAREQRVFEEQTPYLTGSAGDLRP